MSKTFIWETAVAGLVHHTTAQELERLKPGDELTLTLEPENKYDRGAVRVDRAGKKLGYIPATHCTIFSNIVAAGGKLSASIGVVNARKGVVTACIWLELPG